MTLLIWISTNVEWGFRFKSWFFSIRFANVLYKHLPCTKCFAAKGGWNLIWESVSGSLAQPSFFISGCPGWASQTLFISAAKTCARAACPSCAYQYHGRTLLWSAWVFSYCRGTFFGRVKWSKETSLLPPAFPFWSLRGYHGLLFSSHEKLRTSFKGFGGQGDLSMWYEEWKSEGLWESQCDILQCSSRDQSIPMVTALPHCLLRAWLCSQKCTFPTQVSITPLLVCFQRMRRCVGGLQSPSSWALCCFPLRLATLAAWATNSSWVHPKDCHPEPVYAEQASQATPWIWCLLLFQFLFSSPVQLTSITTRSYNIFFSWWERLRSTLLAIFK